MTSQLEYLVDLALLPSSDWNDKHRWTFVQNGIRNLYENPYMLLIRSSGDEEPGKTASSPDIVNSAIGMNFVSTMLNHLGTQMDKDRKYEMTVAQRLFNAVDPDRSSTSNVFDYLKENGRIGTIAKYWSHIVMLESSTSGFSSDSRFAELSALTSRYSPEILQGDEVAVAASVDRYFGNFGDEDKIKKLKDTEMDEAIGSMLVTLAPYASKSAVRVALGAFSGAVLTQMDAQRDAVVAIVRDNLATHTDVIEMLSQTQNAWRHVNQEIGLLTLVADDELDGLNMVTGSYLRHVNAVVELFQKDQHSSKLQSLVNTIKGLPPLFYDQGIAELKPLYHQSFDAPELFVEGVRLLGVLDRLKLLNDISNRDELCDQIEDHCVLLRGLVNATDNGDNIFLHLGAEIADNEIDDDTWIGLVSAYIDENRSELIVRLLGDGMNFEDVVDALRGARCNELLDRYLDQLYRDRYSDDHGSTETYLQLLVDNGLEINAYLINVDHFVDASVKREVVDQMVVERTSEEVLRDVGDINAMLNRIGGAPLGSYTMVGDYSVNDHIKVILKQLGVNEIGSSSKIGSLIHDVWMGNATVNDDANQQVRACVSRVLTNHNVTRFKRESLIVRYKPDQFSIDELEKIIPNLPFSENDKARLELEFEYVNRKILHGNKNWIVDLVEAYNHSIFSESVILTKLATVKHAECEDELTRNTLVKFGLPIIKSILKTLVVKGESYGQFRNRFDSYMSTHSVDAKGYRNIANNTVLTNLLLENVSGDDYDHLANFFQLCKTIG